MAEKINPCPFCRHHKPKVSGKRRGNYVREGTSVYVICQKCHARGPVVVAKKTGTYLGGAYIGGLPEINEAIRLWNERGLA